MHQNKKKTYTKENIIKNIFESVGLPQSYSKTILEDLLASFKEILITDDKLIIKNFGTFFINQKNSRIGRNPKTKEEHQISKRKVISFKASVSIKKYLNKIL